MSPNDRLEPIVRAADGGKDGLLEVLLETWRSTRLPRLVPLIDRLGAEFTAARVPIRDSGADPKAYRSRIVASRRDPKDVGRLLASFPDETPSVALAQLKDLARFPPDPRISEALLDVLEAPPFVATAEIDFYPLLLETIGNIGDPRALQVLLDLRAAEFGRTFANGRRWLAGARRHARFADAAEVLEHNANLSEEFLQGLAEVEVRFGLRTDALQTQLCDAVLADLDDAEALTVFADRCQELGDPRGEVITIAQAGLSDSPRHAQLISAYGRDFAGPLDRVLLRHGRRYRHGFVSEARLRTTSAARYEAVHGSPFWRSLRRLEVPRALLGQRAVDAVILHPVLDGLEALVGHISSPVVEAMLIGDRQRPLLSLQLDSFGVISRARPTFEPAHRNALANARSLPRLRLLALRGPMMGLAADDFAWLLQGPLGEQLESLELATGPRDLVHWIEHLRRSSLRRIVLGNSVRAGRVELQREGSDVSLDCHLEDASEVQDLVHGLELAIGQAMGRVRIHADPTIIDDPECSALHDVRAHFSSLLIPHH